MFDKKFSEADINCISEFISDESANFITHNNLTLSESLLVETFEKMIVNGLRIKLMEK